jgi:hypothetical protein
LAQPLEPAVCKAVLVVLGNEVAMANKKANHLEEKASRLEEVCTLKDKLLEKEVSNFARVSLRCSWNR